MSLAFSPTRYVISTRRKAKRELLLLPAMNDTIGQLDQPEFCPTFKGIICIDICEFEFSLSGRDGVKRFQTAPSNADRALMVHADLRLDLQNSSQERRRNNAPEGWRNSAPPPPKPRGGPAALAG